MTYRESLKITLPNACENRTEVRPLLARRSFFITLKFKQLAISTIVEIFGSNVTIYHHPALS